MSTILDALRKVEGQRPLPAAAAELDRRIVEPLAPKQARPVWRLLIVSAAVLVSVLTGAGVTLLGLTLVQDRLTSERRQDPTPLVSETAPVIEREPAPVVVAAEVLEGISTSEPEAEPELFAVIERVPPPPDADSIIVVVPSPEAREPVVIPSPILAEPEPNAVAKLAAAREARVSRAPPETPPTPAAVVEKRPPPEIVEMAAVDPLVSPPPATLRDSPSAAIPVIVRGALPKVSVTGTTWHPFRQRRSADVAVSEGGETRTREVHEGDEIGPFEVLEISPTGVTLLHDGVQMQRRIGAVSD